MKVLVTGATGFLGSRIVRRLLAAGHSLRCAVRDPEAAAARLPGPEYVGADFTKAVEASDWLPLVRDMDVVINAVGIIREQGGQSFDLLHRRAPRALFAACAESGVRHVIQISALGADAEAVSEYHRSKRDADDFLLGLPLHCTIVQPSLVHGIGGASARLFDTLASFPMIPLPGEGGQQIQPVDVDDLVEAIARLVADPAAAPSRLAIVGPQPLSLRDYLGALRRALGIRTPAFFLPIPMPVVSATAAIAGSMPDVPVDADTLGMLERGNTADAAPLARLLGRPPRPAEDFVPRELRAALATEARMQWLLPVLRTSIAILWIVTAIVSFGVFPVSESLALLEGAGVPEPLRLPALYTAAAFDLALGLLILFRRGRWIWLLQIALILAYMAILTVKLPEFWLHPFGPLTKNIPLLAAIWLLYELED